LNRKDQPRDRPLGPLPGATPALDAAWVLEAMPVGVLAVDQAGKIQLVNSVLEGMFGCSRVDLLGQPVEKLLPERFRDSHANLRAAFWQDPAPRPMGRGRELFALRADGSEFPIEIGLNPRQTPDGFLALAAVVDVTERKLMESAFRRLVDAAPFDVSMADEDSDIPLADRATESLQRLKRLGLYDSLTGLPNRNLFFDRLEQATHAVSRSSTSFTLFMIDLDLFKRVNDTFGHAAGDRVLAEIGQRLQQSSRVSDTYARVGGDEFAGILMGTHSVEDACAVAKSVSSTIKQPIGIGDTTVVVGASIGIAIAPLHGTKSRELLAKADRAMYGAKRGKRDYQLATLASPEPEEDSPGALTRQISDAIERGELVLHFQPKICLQSGKLAGVEALARWNKPGSGLLHPGRFIPAVERTATIAPLTYAILDLALDQMQLWAKRGWSVPVSVNISAQMLDKHELAQRIAAGLARRGLKPELLTLEITESSLMSDPAKARQALNDLAAVGVSISIDDFGSGYSSLAELRELEINEIKLDRPFVEGLSLDDLQQQDRSETIVRSVAALSQGFDINLVAEGIEDRDQVQKLKALGCTMGQGYSLAQPMTARDFSTWWPDWQKTKAQSFAA